MGSCKQSLVRPGLLVLFGLAKELGAARLRNQLLGGLSQSLKLEKALADDYRKPWNSDDPRFKAALAAVGSRSSEIRLKLEDLRPLRRLPTQIPVSWGAERRAELMEAMGRKFDWLPDPAGSFATQGLIAAKNELESAIRSGTAGTDRARFDDALTQLEYLATQMLDAKGPERTAVQALELAESIRTRIGNEGRPLPGLPSPKSGWSNTGREPERPAAPPKPAPPKSVPHRLGVGAAPGLDEKQPDQQVPFVDFKDHTRVHIYEDRARSQAQVFNQHADCRLPRAPIRFSPEENQSLE